MVTADTKMILVDLDGTLAYYDTWHGPAHIGEPIPAMWHRVNTWLNEGVDVRIFTARLAHDQDGQAKAAIEAWCQAHFGRVLPITAEKDFTAVELWDDRAVQVEPNTGRRMDGAEEALRQGLRDMLKVAGLSDVALLEAVQGVQNALRMALRERPIAQKPKKNGVRPSSRKTARRRAS